MEKEIQFPRSESMVRSRRNAKEMFPLVEQWLETRENQKDFCSFHGLPLAVFSYWLKKYREQDGNVSSAGEKKFTVLSIRPASSPGPVVEFPDGVKIRLSVGTSVDYLRELAGQC